MKAPAFGTAKLAKPKTPAMAKMAKPKIAPGMSPLASKLKGVPM